MGYEITQFVEEIDMEFTCSICKMILEDPKESPCEHTFCINCIKQWLSTNLTCPVDRIPLSISNLKRPGRIVRNLLSKFEIKCDFEINGCAEIVRLEHLKDHLASCEYNPDAEIMCDKKRNIKMRRQEYDAHDCNRPPKWHLCHNINIPSDQSEIVGLGDYSTAFAQSFYSVEPRNSSFKIRVLSGVIDIGFSPRGHPISVLIGRNNSSFGYDTYHGELWVNGIQENCGAKAENGDVIEFGIKSPSDFVNDGNSNVELFLSINERFVTQQRIVMPQNAIFPTIALWGDCPKVKLL